MTKVEKKWENVKKLINDAKTWESVPNVEKVCQSKTRGIPKLEEVYKVCQNMRKYNKMCQNVRKWAKTLESVKKSLLDSKLLSKW